MAESDCHAGKLSDKLILGWICQFWMISLPTGYLLTDLLAQPVGLAERRSRGPTKTVWVDVGVTAPVQQRQ